MNVIKVQNEQVGRYTQPVVYVNVKKPRLKNNGYASYNGCPEFSSKEVYDLLPVDKGYEHLSTKQGHITIRFIDGKEFGTYAFTCPEWGYKIKCS